MRFGKKPLASDELFPTILRSILLSIKDPLLPHLPPEVDLESALMALTMDELKDGYSKPWRISVFFFVSSACSVCLGLGRRDDVPCSHLDLMPAGSLQKSSGSFRNICRHKPEPCCQSGHLQRQSISPSPGRHALESYHDRRDGSCRGSSA